MEFRELANLAKEVRDRYAPVETAASGRPWGLAEHAQGFVGDVGDLMKLVMAKNGLRKMENQDEKLAHELSDCLWSLMVIADESGIDLEKAFLKTMTEINARIK